MTTTIQPGTLAHWIATEGAAFLAGPGAGGVRSETFYPAAREVAVVAEDGMEYRLTAVEVHVDSEADPRSIRVLWRLFVVSDGELMDVREQEVFQEEAPPELFSLPSAGVKDERFAALAERWRQAIRAELARAVQAVGEGCLPHEAVPELPVFSVVALCAKEGFPPPSLRLQVDEQRLARLSASARLLPKDAQLPGVQLALEVEGGQLFLCPSTEDDAVSRVWLRVGAEPPFVVLESEDTEDEDGFLFSLDGDAVAMRELLAWASTVLVRSGLDRPVLHRGGEEVAASQWLRFANPQPWSPASLDIRMPRDLLVDQKVHREPEARALQAFYGFIRSHVDPAFRGKRESGRAG